MNKTQIVEKEQEICCSNNHCNEQVILYSMDNKVKGQEKLLCLSCIKEKKSLFQTMNFQEVKEQIQTEQDQLFKEFSSNVTETRGKIDIFKQSIISLKSDLNQKLEELLGKTDDWLFSLQELEKQKAQYSFIKELELFDQSIEQKYITQISVIISYNYSFFQKIQQFFQNNGILNSLMKCENTLKDACAIHYLQKNSINISQTKIQLIQKLERNDNICQNHNKKIMLIDLSKEIKKVQRLKCGLCDKGNSISISEFQQRWQSFYQEKMSRLNNCKLIQGLRLNSVKETLNSLSTNIQEQIRDLVSPIDYSQFLEEQVKLLQEKKEDDLIQIINMAEELSYEEGNSQTQDEILFVKECQSVNLLLQDKMKQMVESLQKAQIAITTELTKEIKLQEKIENSKEIIKINENNLEQKTQLERQVSYELIDEVQHEEWCCAVAFSNIGSIMVSGCGNRVKVWKLENGKLTETKTMLEGHTGMIFCLVFSRKQNWLVTGSGDDTLRGWKDIGNNQWNSSEPYQIHKDSVTCICLNFNEDELISCSRDKSIKIWKVDLQKNQLAYEYSLDKHKGEVFCISLNESETTLVSCGQDKQILIWGKEKNSKWKYKYQILKSADDCGNRICFINDTMIAWQQAAQGFTYIFQQKNDKFVERPDLKIKLNYVGNDSCILFPSVFNKQKKVLIQKHNKFVYVICLQSDGKFKIQPGPIDCNSDDNYGGLTNDGQFLVIWNHATRQIRVYKVQEKLIQ